MKLKQSDWAMEHLHEHLQAAVDLELWTIPFYMSAMYSIKDRDTDAYQLIRTIINQEMLHLQCAANMANAFGLSPKITPPVYSGTKIPHLNFALDPSSETEPYMPYTAEIGPLDLLRVNGMCLVELPEFGTTPAEIVFQTVINEYGTIGAFYDALRFGACLMKNHIKGGVRQVNFFSAFYRNMPNMTVTESGASGFDQVSLLIDLITDQGEGQCKKDPTVPKVFQNTADDTEPNDDHFVKFNQIKDAGGQDGNKLPETYTTKPPCDYTPEDIQLQKILVKQFGQLTTLLEELFKGENPDNFFPIMASVGGAIRNCWEHGVTPQFSNSELSEAVTGSNQR
ncbi:ferritin-like domain-containing protein [Litoribrevibacter euphylliae]|uniref:Ferritin-like domain-containing protein n=1 Tax=Litoribrevibacter euphylliae TaxID=1834034 RepID=A0ABV7HKF9_9GAMM